MECGEDEDRVWGIERGSTWGGGGTQGRGGVGWGWWGLFIGLQLGLEYILGKIGQDRLYHIHGANNSQSRGISTFCSTFLSLSLSPDLILISEQQLSLYLSIMCMFSQF